MDDFYKLAVGVLGISPEYFLDKMSNKAFYLAWEGYNERQKDLWEQTRMISYYSAAPHLKNPKRMDQLIPLGWDKKSSVKKHTPEQTGRLIKNAKEFHGL